MAAYYNEIDPFAAEWLRNLIAGGLIAPGDVDTRSIEDVHPDDLRGYDQCHFFAGIGGWALAARLAGIPDDFPLWTGSCPCQPFSAAGKGAGFADERHLWPAWFHLIRECAPPGVLGEQVASAAAGPWIDLVQADLEGVGYAFGCVPFPAAGIGAPHIRDRTYWVGYADDTRLEGFAGDGSAAGRQGSRRSVATPGESLWLGHANGERQGSQRRVLEGQESELIGGRPTGGMADAHGGECDRIADGEGCQCDGAQAGREQGDGVAPAGGELRRLADCARGGWREEREDFDGLIGGDRQEGFSAGPLDGGGNLRPGPVNGFWGAADWLLCRDGKWRPVSASPQPMVDGIPISLGFLRPDVLQEIEEEVNAWEMGTGIGRSEALRDLWRSAHEAAPRFWPVGRIPGLHEAPFLLAFLRQLAQQGWGIKECLSVPGQEVPQARMRVLWGDIGTPCAPRELRLEGQPSREYSDALRVLSSILARHAHKAWSVAHSAYAETCFPLGTGLNNRVGRLRAYGNAIVPQQAVEFIHAVAEAIALRHRFAHWMIDPDIARLVG